MISVERAISIEALEVVFAIRRTVFVEEQAVPENEEYDEFEENSRHFLAKVKDNPCGTARWRYTDHGVKMERFAVLPDYRGRGVGGALVTAVLNDIEAQPESYGRKRYLHAQLSAVPLYAKFGFQPLGELFYECEIAHYKMELPPTSN
ncbi:MAG: GNAT family N-acetyltransferase [Cytophagaceae bacterium]|nr:GNAT family N-acetyltransferase [Cytophagaceae bacterium]